MRHLLINTVLQNREHTSYCSIHYNGFRNVTYQSWQGNLSEDELAKGYHSSLDIIGRTACLSVINDCRDLAIMNSGNLNQITEQWLMEASSRGVRHVAQVNSSEIPQEIFTDMRQKALESGGYEFELFDTIDEALVWISYKNELA